MDRAEARERALRDARQILDSGGSIEAAARLLRGAGVREDEVQALLGRSAAERRGRARRAGAILLIASGLGLLVFALTVPDEGGFLHALAHSRRGSARTAWWLIGLAVSSGTGLSMVLFGR